jgi:presenilin-like A22 family membrane protease
MEIVMVFYIIAGLFSAFAIIFLLAKFDFKKVLWLDIPIDIASTILLVFMFAGTFAGMMAAVIGGCIISAFLWATKRLKGYKKPKWNRFWFQWVEVQPTKQ